MNFENSGLKYQYEESIVPIRNPREEIVVDKTSCSRRLTSKSRKPTHLVDIFLRWFSSELTPLSPLPALTPKSLRPRVPW